MKKALYRRRTIGLRERLYDRDERVQCLECGRWFKIVSGSHLGRIHLMTIQEYCHKHNVLKDTLMGKDTRNKKIRLGKELYRKGIIGTPESLTKARKAGSEWLRLHPEEARRNAHKASVAGGKARMKYWNNDKNRKKKSKWMKKELERRLKNPAFKEKWENRESIKNFTEARRKEFERLEKELVVCAICGKKFHHKVFYRHGSRRHDVRTKCCSKKCRIQLMLRNRKLNKENETKR